MATQRQATLKAFGWSLAIQGVVYLLYLLFGVDRSGSGTMFQNYYFFFYFPIMLICLWFQSTFAVGGWGSVWFLIYIAPVLGALSYSSLYASAVWKWRAFGKSVESGMPQQVGLQKIGDATKDRSQPSDGPPSVN